MKINSKYLLLLIAAVMLVPLLTKFTGAPQTEPNQSTSYSQFIEAVRNGEIDKVFIEDQSISGMRADGGRFQTYNPDDPGLMGELLNHNVTVTASPPETPSALLQMLIGWFPILLLIGVYIFIMRRGMGGMGGGSGLLGIGRSKARKMEADEVKVTFADVAGVEEAKEEVAELVEFLQSPAKFHRLGGRVPRGALMVGSPGTGKTLLAKAIAGEASVPFFSISGSDFVEMFVGVGASRVRDLFKQAKEHAPCIIFIDEIDAVGRRRGAGVGGGNDEREQTLNQLLVEMDGFEGDQGVIVIAATNRPDVLDPALLRPGRFDRQIVVPLPDVGGREQILHVHTRKVPLAGDIDLHTLARGTPGFSGADLANLVNEAALMAARNNLSQVTMTLFERAKDKILMGAERRSMVMNEEEKQLTAYHEAGHTIVGHLVPDHDPVHKVSIIPRGRALGVTLFLPEQDRLSLSKRRLDSQIATLFGGRIAEQLVFGEDAVTTGAQNDISRATDIARNMVTQWGLSDKLGVLSYGNDEEETFIGQSISKSRDFSPITAAQIDTEIRAIIDRNYQRAHQILTEHLETLHAMAAALMQYETLEGTQIDAIMDGREPPPPQDGSWLTKNQQGGNERPTPKRRRSRVGPPAELH